MKTIIIESTVFKDEPRIKLIFDYDDELIGLVKKIPGSRWSRTMRCWHIPSVEHIKYSLETYLPGVWLEKKGNDLSARNVKTTVTAEADPRKKIFYISLPYELKDDFKKLEGAWWHPGARIWSAVDNSDNRTQLKSFLEKAGFKLVFVEKAAADKPALPQRPTQTNNGIQPVPDKRFERRMRLEGKSKNTIRQYISYVSWYLSVQPNDRYAEDAAEKVRSFIYDYVVKKKYGQNQQNGVISALKQYYLSVFGIELDATDLPRPKKKRILPKVISEEEFKRMLRVTKNTKHKLILQLLFGCGLRRNEVCELKKSDIDFERGLVYVKGKGNKYRAVNPGFKLLKKISEYLKSYLPQEYLFEGPKKQIYSGTSVYTIVTHAADMAGIERKVYPHMLRHTFATLLMEKGVELRIIQEALGHSSSKTTEIYTYVSRANIKKMPALLDTMEI